MLETAVQQPKTFGQTEMRPSYRMDLRQYRDRREYEKFVKVNTVNDWSTVTWKDIGKPYEVTSLSKEKTEWEQAHGEMLPVHTSWTMFNQSFHEWFSKDVPTEIGEKKGAFLKSLTSFKLSEVKTALGDYVRIHLWNYVHRIQDGIWDPRGKRALFEGLDVDKPRILFLGAAEGYEAMQLSAMYPDGEVVMVDYDPFCRDTRFAEFPESYPFLGKSSRTGGDKVYYKNDFNISYVVDDIRNLPYGREFDIVLSVGLLEHFPDSMKAEVVEWHRKFLKPSGYIVMTTPRAQMRSKLYYEIMADVMNHTYRELMTLEQMGLYLHENGLEILRHGYIKVHNGIVARAK
ncbi:class I SAM-dependent methyltransferase [Fictibacillus norfolkensis]|uniref:Class I SAM-dependent methyltransferase n=1 Tax=Fictibacillus norfolkensis TaxID=2762233 RepID=A0ABR8SNM5_9BACL|nr:class I SAM-dependent methyltransferase [Fictibacillus norfolkensis]MBD7965025.1 class I SAM-dependent methyltransferase [Fictibacillus norfolkensis]